MLPKEVSIDEYKDVDSGKVSLRLYFNTVDTSWSGGMAELASLAVTPIAEYEDTKAKCIENKSEYEDIACSLGMGAPIIGMANGNIFTFYSAHE
jgi:hypothetical protein